LLKGLWPLIAYFLLLRVTEERYFNFDQFPADWGDRIESADLVGVQKRGRSALL
jgi:hypothetical protein